MTAVEKIRTITAKELIMAMVRGLENPKIAVSMGTYGGTSCGLCHGCAATVALCELAGAPVPSEMISLPSNRASFYGAKDWIDTELITNFERAVDILRRGNVDLYNLNRKKSLPFIDNIPEHLPYLLDIYTQEDLEVYKRLAEHQQS